jgi:hypothetical protein
VNLGRDTPHHRKTGVSEYAHGNGNCHPYVSNCLGRSDSVNSLSSAKGLAAVGDCCESYGIGLGASKPIVSMRPKITCRFRASRQFSPIRPTATRLTSTQGLVCNYRDIQDPTFSQCTMRYLRLRYASSLAVIQDSVRLICALAMFSSISLHPFLRCGSFYSLLDLLPSRLFPCHLACFASSPLASHAPVMRLCYALLHAVISMRQKSPSYPDHSRGLLSCRNRRYSDH